MFITVIVFFAILTVLVLIHELGHFTVAKLIGVNVEEFGLGLPPRIFGKKFGSTIYSVNALPIGGFVKLSGEDEDPSEKTKKSGSTKQFFWARSKKERSAILIAGVFMNFFLAVGITAFLLTTGVNEPSGKVRVDKIFANSPAEKAGLVAGDILVSIASPNKSRKVLKQPKELIGYVNETKGYEVVLTVLRGSKEFSITLTPRITVPKGEGPLGVAISDLELHTYPWTEAPQKALIINFSRARDMLTSLGATLWRLVTLRPPESEVAGPIGIAVVTGQAVKFGWKAVLEFASILSLNLAVLNVLPIPALDGGRLAFVVFEKLLKRRVHPAFERSTHQIGMIILLALVLLVSINDILRLVHG